MSQEVNHDTNYLAWTKPGNRMHYTKDAKKGGKSLNRVALDMINKSMGSDKKPAADSLGKLAGGWSEKDAME